MASFKSDYGHHKKSDVEGLKVFPDIQQHFILKPRETFRYSLSLSAFNYFH